MTANDDHETGHTELEAGDVLYDGASGEEYALVVDVDDAGVTVRQGDIESFVPHALFAPWNGDELLVSHGRGPDERERTRYDADSERDRDTHEQPRRAARCGRAHD